MSEKTGTIFELEEFKPYRKRWDRRQRELNLRAAYYDGSIYRGMNDATVWSLGPRAAKEIKPLFLPLARAVDIDAGIIGGDWTFPPEDTEPKSATWSAARDALFDMSRWDTKGVLYSHYGAMYGISGIRVADVREGNKHIDLQPARPTCFMLGYEGVYSDSPAVAFWIEKREDETDSYEYAEVITPASIRTYRNGVLFGFDGRDPEYANEQGVVPIVEIFHLDDGTEFGECTYQKAILPLNEVNTMATRLSDIIAKNSDPQWTVTGAEPSDLKRGSSVMWFLPEGAAVAPVVPVIDIPGVIEFIKEIKAVVYESLPELSFDEIRKAGQIATQTLELQLMELVIKIERVRPNYDRGLVTAMQMAGKAAVSMGLSEITPLDDDELILDPNRPILPQMPQDKIALRMSEIELEQMEAGLSQNEGAAPNA